MFVTESNSGFSFGAPPDSSDDGTEEVDAIEVSGEPVTRSEAKNMGLVSFESGRHEAHGSLPSISKEQLPSDISDELTNKLEAAWSHLKRNEIEEALTLAQEVVWEYPALVAAKLIIARCFINRKEYEKALAILQAISENDMNSETLYYIGLCQSRLGRIKEAIDTLKLTRASSADTVIRKRASDLLLHLQGEQTVCPVCGKKTLYDSMVDVGDQTVCNNCAKSMTEEEEDEDFDEEELSGKRRKRLRRPLTWSEILMRLVFAIFLAGVLLFGVYILSFISPYHYSLVRGYLPASWTFLPEVGSTTPTTTGQPVAPTANMQMLPVLPFSSPSISHVISGVEILHQLEVEGLGRRQGQYTVNFFPAPEGKYDFDQTDGTLRWTPTPGDNGKTFEITFGALFSNARAKEQVNSVKVSAGPRFRKIHSLPPAVPGRILNLLSTDMDNDNVRELIIVSGGYWDGVIDVIHDTGDGFYSPSTSTTVPGRPVGAGVIMADGEKWLAVADYWNSRLRHYAMRGNSLSEMAVDINLPGPPILAGFDRESSVSSVICSGSESLQLACYRQVGQLSPTHIGTWSLPDEFSWRKILVLPGKPSTTGELASIPVVFGNDPENSVFIADFADNRLVPCKLPATGTLIDAVLGPYNRVHCLVENAEGRREVISFTLSSAKGAPENVIRTPAGEGPALGGFVVANFFGAADVVPDVAVFSAAHMSVLFNQGTDGASQAHFWELPAPARMPGAATRMPATPENPEQVIFADGEGGLWSASLVDREGMRQ